PVGGHAHAMEGPYHVLSVRSVTTSRSGAHPVLTARGAIKVARWPSGRPTRANPMPLRHWCRFRRTGFMEYPASEAASLRLDAGEFDHLGPLFGFVGNQLSEVSRRSRQRHAAEVSETGLHLRVVESRVDLLVELVDDLGRRGPRCAEAGPTARLVS